MLTKAQKAIAAISSVFNFTAEKAGVYDEMLKDIPDDLVEAAIRSLLLTSKYAPTVADIREEAERIYRQATGMKAPDAGRAWGEVVEAISRYGAYRNPVFRDPLCAETVKRMGWKELCMTPIDSVGVSRGQFMKIYTELAMHVREEKRINQMLVDGKIKQLVSKIAESKRLEEPK